MAPQPPSPKERFALAEQHARLLNALHSHPGIATKADGSKEVDRARTHPTLYNVMDFVRSTYTKYIVQTLPPDATKNCKALAIQPAQDLTENKDKLADSLYPSMEGLADKWQDAVTRGVMISMIILDPGRQAMFGGAFDFGSDVKAAAEALAS